MHTEKQAIEVAKYRTPQMFNTSQFKEAQKSFEKNLGIYSYNHPDSYRAVNLANSKMEEALFPFYKQKVNQNASRLQFLQDVFVHDESAYSSGQIGREMGKYIEYVCAATTPLDDNIPDDIDEYKKPGNLREKMTAFYNACLFNGDKVDGDKRKDIVNFKRYMKDYFTRSYNYMRIEYESLPAGSVKKARLRNRYELFKNGSKHDFFKFDFLFHFTQDKTLNMERDYLIIRRKQHPPLIHKLGFQHELGPGLGPSAREEYYQKEKSRDGEHSEILSGGELVDIIEPSSTNNIQKLLDSGFRLSSSISCTSARLLRSCQWLQIDYKQLLNFRMALFGWMLPNNDHSLYEILKGSHLVGILGKEKMNNADTMDRTVSPLDEETLRDKVCDKYDGQKLFPLEIAILKINEENGLPNNNNQDEEDIESEGEFALL